ncbi:MAG: Dabb family protein [Mucilaginibacter sp.]|nr:Dabb family protein [Mucilaginibacter sp.]
MSTSNRRKFITTTAALAAGTIAASAMPLSDHQKEEFPVVHHVFFWLKNPGSVEDRDKLVAGVKTLAKIETVKKLKVGVVASTEKRDVVDNSWAVSELMFFSDLAGQATYQTHPIHLEFIKNCGHLWEKVIVYDAVDA